jgi:protein TonB
MLAYAASRPKIGARHSSPNALLIVISVHVAALAALMSAKMELPTHQPEQPLIVDTIHPPKPPPPDQKIKPQQPHQQAITRPDTTVVIPLPDPLVADPTPQVPIIDSWPGQSVDPPPRPNPQPLVVRTGARLLTPSSELKPPYPPSKLLAEEEATLRLRLTIDERGRVVAVDPVGRADSAFLDAARRYLIAHWRYRPASDGGRAIASSEVITLRFQLDG